ncbi:MAG: DUF2793 domain-containing protein [Hyphomicrobiales bacterium]|nr:DUF2793 domain-containing protein [Hyphomicrobiales bacterium]
MSNSTRLALPFIDGAQSQKHVTHNEALVALDALVHLAVKARDVAAPPAAPAEGDRYLVPTGASGDFAGHVDAVAAFDDGAWAFLTPRAGWRAYVETEDTFLLFDGVAWKDVGLSLRSLQNLSRLGIGATADAANPLLAKLNNALLTARAASEGGTGDLRIALNKSAASATVSQLYQTNYSGRAETGLAGDDNFHLKVSADGSVWKEALNVDSASGVVSFPNGLAHKNPGFRNRLINGSFDVWQRGTSFSVAHAAQPYLADRWHCYNAFLVTATVSKAPAPAGFLGAQAINIAATGVAATKLFDLRQKFESRMVADLDGKACVLSLDVSASTSAGSLTAQAILLGNAAVDDGSYSVTMASPSFTVPIGVGRVAIPFTAAQTTGLKNGAMLLIRFTQIGATGNPNITLGAVQFEADPSGAGKANPFEFRPPPVENAMCKRYYWRSQLSDLIGPVGGTTTVRSIGRHPVTMRAAPTAVLLKTTFENGGPYNLQSGTAWIAATGCAISSYGISTETYSIVISGFSGLTNGALVTGNGPSEVFEFSAEL